MSRVQGPGAVNARGPGMTRIPTTVQSLRRRRSEDYMTMSRLARSVAISEASYLG